MSLACIFLVAAIVCLSAFIRLSGAGLGCEPWPRCYGDAWRSAIDGAQVVATPGVVAARIAHRVLAVAALLVIVAMVMAAWSRSPALRREGRLALALMGLALFLAALGRVTAGSRVPAVTLGNLLAGFGMLAVCWQLAFPPANARTRLGDRLVPWALIALTLLVAQVLLGGLVSASHSGFACPQLARCDTSAASWQLLNPLLEPSTDPSDPAGPAGAWIHWLHRAGAMVLVLVLLPLAITAWRRGQNLGAWIAALLLLEAALGAWLVAAGLPLAAALAHNMGAAVLLALLVALIAGAHRTPSPQPAGKQP
jgi:cytochrome c oxidase assembly protein subunit 15